jgi:5-oxoprolinase (ATP-hydrolysing)
MIARYRTGETWKGDQETPIVDIALKIGSRWRKVGLKLESHNPSGSIKYRTACGLITALEASDRLAPGTHIVESTSGNLGVALAFLSQVRGYRFTAITDPKADPVMLEVFNNLFMSIAEQMGVTLQNTAYSVNIKERLDFSCALFDGEGNLVANAPHMPVHLGSMGESVQEILRRRGRDIQPGDAFALNAPYAGGTHLPDVTVTSFDAAVTAVLNLTSREPLPAQPETR